MTDTCAVLNHTLDRWARAPLALPPTPIHRIENFSRALGGPELWIKRDDLTGLEGGGNKTHKLEYLVGEAQPPDGRRSLPRRDATTDRGSGGGHFAAVEQPALLSRDITEFFADLGAH